MEADVIRGLGHRGKAGETAMSPPLYRTKRTAHHARAVHARRPHPQRADSMGMTCFFRDMILGRNAQFPWPWMENA